MVDAGPPDAAPRRHALPLEVGAGGIRVTETERDRRGEPRRETVIDVPAWEIAAVGAITTKRRIRLVASDPVRKELASVTLDELPDGGADALAARILARLRAGQPGGNSLTS